MHLEIPLTKLLGPLKLGLPDVVKATAKTCSFLRRDWAMLGHLHCSGNILNIMSLVNACGCHIFVRAPLSV